MIVECRIPTFKRPELLKRALESVRAQSATNWRAIILDDSLDHEAQEVVSGFNDNRFHYRANDKQYGATGNLNLAFNPEPLVGGDYAFVLEDDNAIDRDFIKVVLEYTIAYQSLVLSTNQLCVNVSESMDFVLAGELRQSHVPFYWDRDALLTKAFLGESLPNGSFFWKLNSGIDLTVNPDISEPQLQECVRQTRVNDGVRVLMIPEKLSLWSNLPSSLIRRKVERNRVLAANLNALSASIVNRLSLCNLHLQIEACFERSRPKAEEILCDISLINLGCRRWLFKSPSRAFRAFLRYHMYCTNHCMDSFIC